MFLCGNDTIEWDIPLLLVQLFLNPHPILIHQSSAVVRRENKQCDDNDQGEKKNFSKEPETGPHWSGCRVSINTDCYARLRDWVMEWPLQPRSLNGAAVRVPQ